MPLLLPVNDLRSGMRLARPLISGRKLVLPQGKVIDGADVDALSRRYPTLHVLVVDPILDDAIEFQDDSRDKAVAEFARKRFTHTIKQAQDAMHAEASLGRMDFRAIELAVVDIIRFLCDNPTAWAVVFGDEDACPQMAEHAGNTFYLSMILGNAVRGYVVDARRQHKRHLLPPTIRQTPSLAPLGLAALLMDVSLWPLHQEVGYDKPLSPEQRELVLQHPEISADLLPETVPQTTRNAVRSHHENDDGSGYPCRLAGDRIPLFARVLRVADAYSAATSIRVGRPAKSPVKAMWEMTSGPYARFYNPIILKMFRAVVQPYPIGAKVRLTSGQYAVVVRHGRAHGLLPEVIVAFDEGNKPLPRRHLIGPCPLDQHPELRIASFGDEDLTDVYGDDPVFCGGDPLDASDFHTLIESTFP